MLGPISSKERQTRGMRGGQGQEFRFHILRESSKRLGFCCTKITLPAGRAADPGVGEWGNTGSCGPELSLCAHMGLGVECSLPLILHASPATLKSESFILQFRHCPVCEQSPGSDSPVSWVTSSIVLLQTHYYPRQSGSPSLCLFFFLL